MKEKILKALREAGEEYVSGVELCEKFGVSRQAVWKHIAVLKENGYQIEAVGNKGYRLASSPDRLYGPDIESRMSQNCICHKVLSFGSVDSTNIKAKQLAEIGEEEGTLIVAEEQTAGKGRRGRDWKSERGTGIWMTLLLRPSVTPFKVSGLTLLAALAVARGIQEVCGISARIKWPNDIVVSQKKLCGILTEMSSEENYIHYVVVGIGINVNRTKFEEELEKSATSLYLETGKKVDRCQLIARTMEYFSEYYKQYIKAQNLSSFVEEYNAFLANKDREVRVYYGMVENADLEKTDVGIARGINEDGALLVEINGETKEIVSGEVSVRGLYGYV